MSYVRGSSVVVILERAFKHGLSEEQILHAYRISSTGAIIRAKDREKYPPTYVLIGFDKELREIELLYTIDHLGRKIIFHANYATKQFKKQLGE